MSRAKDARGMGHPVLSEIKIPAPSTSLRASSVSSKTEREGRGTLFLGARLRRNEAGKAVVDRELAVVFAAVFDEAIG
jgi:hypothetical protein